MRIRWLLLPAAAFITVAAVMAAAVTGAAAHGVYEASAPIQNEVLPEPPTSVDMWFSQELLNEEGANFVRVFDEQDVQVSQGDGILDADDQTHVSTTFTTLPSELPDGRYIVRWMTTSAVDQDTVQGAFCFFLRVEPTEEQQAECTRLAHGAGVGNGDSGGFPTRDIVVGVVAGLAVLLIVVGGVAVWRRQTPA